MARFHLTRTKFTPRRRDEQPSPTYFQHFHMGRREPRRANPSAMPGEAGAFACPSPYENWKPGRPLYRRRVDRPATAGAKEPDGRGRSSEHDGPARYQEPAARPELQ